MPIVTLLTDFGESDGYVGVLKGVILGLAPGTSLVDLSHTIAPQDIGAAAYVLGRTYRYFPNDTIHLAVVDPGVGSTRRPLLLDTSHGRFVGPDNGLFTPILTAEADVKAYRLDQPAYWHAAVSTTFHGRDVFAPVAAHLARGVLPTAVGHPIAITGLVQLPTEPPQVIAGGVLGRISYIDRFGNAITDITAALLTTLTPPIQVTVNTQPPIPLHATYAAVAAGRPLALLGSDGTLEVSIRDGHAAQTLGCRVGDPIRCMGASNE